MRNECIAVAILESFTDPIEPKQMKKVKHDMGLWTIKFYSNLQDFDVRNRNGRIYKASAMIPAFQTPEIKELLRTGSFLGEYGHPVGKNVDISRIANVIQGEASHRILTLDVDQKGVGGWIETLPDGKGALLAKNMIIGLQPAFSLRALSRIQKDRNGTQIIATPPRIITYDCVIRPSHACAYQDMSKGSKIMHYDIPTQESVNIDDQSFEIMQESLMDFIAMESTNVKLVSNQHEVCLEGMQLAGDNKSVLIKDGGVTYMVKLEDELKHIVQESLINL